MQDTEQTVTVELTVREATAVTRFAGIWAGALEDEGALGVGDDGGPVALITGLMKLEASLVIAGVDLS